jgi:hypothetical protein
LPFSKNLFYDKFCIWGRKFCGVIDLNFSLDIIVPIYQQPQKMELQ